MWQKILVPVDSSPSAQIVFESALSLAKSTGGSLILLHVLSMDDEDAPAPVAFTGQYTRNRVTGEYDTKASILEKRKQQWYALKKKRLEPLNAMKNKAAQQDVNTQIVQVFGSPTRTICEQAQKYAVDLIIMGNRGISAIEKIVVGSVSSYVVENADCSVLIARIPDEKEIKIKWEQILVAVDSSQMAKIVFDRSLSLAKSTGATLNLLEVLSLDDWQTLKAMRNEGLEGMKNGGLEPLDEAIELMQEETLELMKDPALELMKNSAIEREVNIKVMQILGSPGRTICKQAEEIGVDLIVVGNRGLSGLKKMILGSVSSYVINHANCSVLIARN